MKRYFLILLVVAFSAASCCPCRHLATSSRDSVRMVTSVRTVERLVRDTVLVPIPAQSERQTVRDTVSRLENDFAASCARINPNGSLYHDLRTKPRQWLAAVDRRETEMTRTDTVYINRERREVVEVPRELTWWQRMQMRGFWVLVSVVGWWVWRRIRR